MRPEYNYTLLDFLTHFGRSCTSGYLRQSAIHKRQTFEYFAFWILITAISLGIERPALSQSNNSPVSDWRAGLSKVDITPKYPIRLSGYGSRSESTEQIATPLHIRCLALENQANEIHLILSVESIGLPGEMTHQVTKAIQDLYSIPRERIVVCSTHTHCAPALGKQLSNIFSTPLNEQEAANAEQYGLFLIEQITKSVEYAIESMQPADLSYACGNATFAANRRVLTNGKWSQFGIQDDGPVDHSVPLLKIQNRKGVILGLIFNYACHCTTLGGDYNEINGDWAGYASRILEQEFPNAVALCTIGCGADANPNPRGSVADAIEHGQTLASEIKRLADGSSEPVTSNLEAHFDYASLNFNLPTQEELRERLDDSDNQTRRHAERQLAILKEHGRLPATYPVPIQSWRFGDQLGMIFLGGEVVADYALRIRKELGRPNLWVTAYANDVMGYVASERMIAEEGYEYSRSSIYYGLPGPWASGTEDKLIERMSEVFTDRGRSKPLDTNNAIQSFELPEGYTIELVASEPLIRDPINLAFDAAGDMWVVEMGGYPEKENGGRIKRLRDQNHDGMFDESITLLKDLSFPTGVLPWGNGVLISIAPDIVFAADTNDDGVADLVEPLYSGFGLANPQHRINGFTYDLDHSVHLASGDNLGDIKSVKTDEVMSASGRDVQVWPQDGRMRATSGRSQYVRSRSDWREWFGNDNSRPLFHFPIEEVYWSKNPHIKSAGHTHQLFNPPVAPPVYPLTSTSERFNDLFAASRFTSACSPIFARAPGYDASDIDTNFVSFICEPVHNLVHRTRLENVGATYRANRNNDEYGREFLRSHDPWFRPVRAAIGPDGCLYIVDMYRETIEHPEWIPESWQEQLDLYAGADRGRIYRIRPPGNANPLPDLTKLNGNELVSKLSSDIGALRDLAHQRLIETGNSETTASLKRTIRERDSSPQARVHCAYILAHANELQDEILLELLASHHAGLLYASLPLVEPRLNKSDFFIGSLKKLTNHPDLKVVLRLALTLSACKHEQAGDLLASLAFRTDLDHWTQQAILCASADHADAILDGLLKQDSLGPVLESPVFVSNLVRTVGEQGTNIFERYGFVLENDELAESTKIRFAVTLLNAQQISQDPAQNHLLRTLYNEAISLASNSDHSTSDRRTALQLLGIGLGTPEKESRLLLELIHPSSPSKLQESAIDRYIEINGNHSISSLISIWNSMTSQLRSHCAGRILERRGTSEQLLTAIEEQVIQFDSLPTSARQQLAQTGTRSMRVRAQRLMEQPGDADKKRLISHYQSIDPSHGDEVMGKELFKKHCAVCHSSMTGEDPIGASLDNLSKVDTETLLTAILDPNRAVDPQYHQYLIQLDDGRTIAGRILNESGTSISVAVSDGKRHEISRTEIESMKNIGISLMPEGLEQVLPPEQMTHLIRYLQNNRQRK